MGRRTYFSFLLLLIFLFLTLSYFAATKDYFSFDLLVTHLIQRIDSLWFKQLMWLLTEIGYMPTLLIVTSLICLIFLIFRKWLESLMIGFSAITILFVGEVVKNVIHRSRPNPMLIEQIHRHINRDSFPSGHVLFFIGLFGFAGYLIYVNVKNSLLKSFLIILIGALIFLIGISRIYLGDHWFSDVLGSYLLGAIWLNVIIVIYLQFLKIIKQN